MVRRGVVIIFRLFASREDSSSSVDGGGGGGGVGVFGDISVSTVAGVEFNVSRWVNSGTGCRDFIRVGIFREERRDIGLFSPHKNHKNKKNITA